MRISFECRTNKNYVAINTAKFVLSNGLSITVDRDTTEYGIEDGILTMTWKHCYLWAINGHYLFDKEAYLTDASAFEDLIGDAKVVFELEDDVEDRDYKVECVDYYIGE